MGSILKNVVRFTGLAVGVPTVLPHLLNINGTAVAPQQVDPQIGGSTVAVDAINVTVTRATGPADLDVYVERWHSFESALPPGNLAGLVPFILGQAPGSSGPVASSILWAPGGGGNATTWEEVMAFVAASFAPIDIYVNANATIPVGTGPYAMKGSKLIADPLIGSITVSMADGAQLLDLGWVVGLLILRGNATAVTPLIFTPGGGAPSSLVLYFNGTLDNAGTIPMIDFPVATFFVLGLLLNGNLGSSGGAPIVNMGAGGVMIVGVFGEAMIPNDWITGPAGSTLLYQNFGGLPSPEPTNAGFAGATIQNLLLGASCTGPATRPFNPFGPLNVGSMVFDQSLGLTGKPIWWDGTQWVDATGAPA